MDFRYSTGSQSVSFKCTFESRLELNSSFLEKTQSDQVRFVVTIAKATAIGSQSWSEQNGSVHYRLVFLEQAPSC